MQISPKETQKVLIGKDSSNSISCSESCVAWRRLLVDSVYRTSVGIDRSIIWTNWPAIKSPAPRVVTMGWDIRWELRPDDIDPAIGLLWFWGGRSRFKLGSTTRYDMRAKVQHTLGITRTSHGLRFWKWNKSKLSLGEFKGVAIAVHANHKFVTRKNLDDLPVS